jgi:hypothetical protein
MVARYKDRVGTLVVSGATALARNRSDPYARGCALHLTCSRCYFSAPGTQPSSSDC